jgi:hypothetical protein
LNEALRSAGFAPGVAIVILSLNVNSISLFFFFTNLTRTSLGPNTSTTSGEVSSSGTGYTTGGKALVNSGTSVVSTVAFTDFADLSFQSVTLTARGCLIYNTSFSNSAVAVLNFTTDKTATAGTFTIQFPAFTSSAAIIRIS